MNVEKRQEIERKVVCHLICKMKESGYELVWVHDGEAKVKCSTEAEALDTVFSVDESTIGFKKTLADKKFGAATGVTHSVYVVLGNDGYDCLADHSLNSKTVLGDDFEAVMDTVQTYADSLCK